MTHPETPTGTRSAVSGDVGASGVALNTDPPDIRCGMCGGRCKPEGRSARWITCRSGCAWSSHSPRRTGLRWWLRVLVGR